LGPVVSGSSTFLQQANQSRRALPQPVDDWGSFGGRPNEKVPPSTTNDVRRAYMSEQVQMMQVCVDARAQCRFGSDSFQRFRR
jgi:hypothetical protein